MLYHDETRKVIMRRQLPVAASQAAYLTPTPISTIDLGSGLRPLSFYANSGEVAARQIESLSFAVEDRRALVRVGLLTDAGRRAEFESCTLLRN